MPAFDLHCPLLSLPHAFRITLANVPAKASYLSAAMEQRATWRSRLSASRGPRVGLMWTGNPHHVNDRHRSVPIESLRPLVQSGVGTFYSLQKEYRSDGERQLAVSCGIADLSRDIGDFDSTAGLVAELDLIISVDTSMAHLAAALGRPTWVLLPLSPDWRWLLQREDSPWYPTVRLFRQEQAGDWTHPVSSIRTALAGVTAS